MCLKIKDHRESTIHTNVSSYFVRAVQADWLFIQSTNLRCQVKHRKYSKLGYHTKSKSTKLYPLVGNPPTWISHEDFSLFGRLPSVYDNKNTKAETSPTKSRMKRQTKNWEGFQTPRLRIVLGKCMNKNPHM